MATPPGQLPPGQVLSWQARYGSPPARNALIFARIMLGIQAGLWSLSLLAAPLAFLDKPLPPGVTSQYGDLHAPSLLLPSARAAALGSQSHTSHP